MLLIAAGGGRLRAKVAVGGVVLAVSGAFAGGITFGALGAIGQLAHMNMIPIAVCCEVVLSWAAWWHAGRRVRFPGARQGVQANRRWAQKGLEGQAYFGALLGAGFVTELATPLVLAGGSLAVLAGGMWGTMFGVGFGLGRTVIGWMGMLPSVRQAGSQELVVAVLRLRESFRWPSIVVALGGVAWVALGIAPP